MSRVLHKSDDYETFGEMNEDVLNQIYSPTEEIPTGRSKEKSSGREYTDKETDPPLKKKQKSSLLTVFKTTGEDTDNDNDDIVTMDTDDDEEDEGHKDDEED
jgi:hypothetical protein